MYRESSQRFFIFPEKGPFLSKTALNKFGTVRTIAKIYNNYNIDRIICMGRNTYMTLTSKMTGTPLSWKSL